jgi:opacity protein-like surface antigen
MKKLATTLLVAFFFCIGVQTADAQIGIRIGPRVGYDIDQLNELFVGADVRLDVATLPVIINPAFDYYFVDGFDLYQLSINALYTFGINNTAFTPYVGGGLGITRTSVDTGVDFIDGSNTDIGLNIVGGAEFGFGNLRPFVQAQLTLGDVDLTTIAGGVLFSLGG